MRLALLSDIHANLEALRAIAPEIVGCDYIVCLGDTTGYYCDVNETLDWVRMHATHCVLGNHDRFLLTGRTEALPDAVRFGVEHAAETIDRAHLDWLRTLPHVWGGQVSDRTLLAVHGSPWDPMGDYLYPNHPKLSNLSEFAFDLLGFGQTHCCTVVRSGDKLAVNPGSVGQPRDLPCHASAVLIETNLMTVRKLRVEFDPTPIISRARERGAGDWITKHFV